MSLPIDHARLPKPGDIFGEKYRLECVLGSGGMGVVFGATHLITHKRVAIKWLAGEAGGGSLSDTTQRFVREARLAGEFHHPNIVQVYDLGESDGSFYMVMEWLEGESLAARLERVGRLTFAEACACLIPCMRAMQRAHDAGIVHRDIKPANIFLCDATEDRPALSKVLDFGISKRITASADVTSFVTKTGMLIGTPHYLAPEQLRARPVDRRTDVYGFGVLLYQTLAGTLPFTADNFGDLVVEISVGTPRSLRELVPDLPVGVEQVVARAMARELDDRYPSLHELIASLEAIDPTPLTAATLPQIEAPASLRPISTIAANSSSSRTHTMLAVAAGATLLAAALGFMLLQQDQRAREETSSLVRPREIVPVQHNTKLPALDAGVDSGLPLLLGPLEGALADESKPAQPITPAAQPHDPTAAQPREQAKGAVAPIATTIAPAREPSKAAEAQPTEAAHKPKLTIPPREPSKAAEAQPTEATDKPKLTIPPRSSPKPQVSAPIERTPEPSPPSAAAAPAPSEPRAPEHNPLHMDIQ